MNTRTTTALALTALAAAATACTATPQPVHLTQPQTVSQWCGQYDPATGQTYQVPDTQCEDNASPVVVWYYGGTSAYDATRRRHYMRGASKTRPVGVVLVVRAVDKGGDSRTVGRIISSNTAVRNQGLSTSSGSGGTSVKSGSTGGSSSSTRSTSSNGGGSSSSRSGRR